MTVNNAVALRICNLLDQRKWSNYYLEKVSGIPHGALDRIMGGKNKTVTLTTVYKVAKGFGMTINEFLADPIFDANRVEFD